MLYEKLSQPQTGNHIFEWQDVTDQEHPGK